MKSTPALSLLLTNLQLLDYNSSNESTPLSIETFTSLKNKGKTFEHVINHLFRTYQPEEAAIKFQACWPIYEPVQARELRNVVFKWLTDLKRSGQLQVGGNVIIRRSLFDDCAGERYEELLLALSTMVLRLQVERGVFQENFKQTIAFKQCNTHTPSSHLLTPLILAYQSSLTRLLASRNASKAEWRSFSALLNEKETEFASVRSDLTSTDLNSTMSPEDENSIVARWRSNWLGDERLLDILVNGDPDLKRQKLLETSFEEAISWHKAIPDSNNGSDLALSGLNKQVEEQTKRVEELKKVRVGALNSVISGETGASNGLEGNFEPEKVKAQQRDGLQVKFNKHQEKQVPQQTIPSCPSTFEVDENSQFSILLLEMRNELTAVEHNRRRRRPRPVTSSFRPYDLQQDYNLGLNSQAFEPQIPTRRSNLPQPSRTSRNAAIVNSKPHIPLPLKVPSDPKYETLKRLRAQKLEESLKISSIQDHGIEPRNEVKAPGNEWDEEDTPSEGFSPLSDKMPGLSSPVTLSSRGNDPDQSIRQTFSASSNVSDDENFSDIGDEAPYRVTHTPPSTIPRDGSPTPKPYGDPNVNESTPTQGKFKASEPPQSSLVYGRNRESFAEEIVSTVTSAAYSPERPYPIKQNSLPTPRARFGFYSPDVSPMKEERSFMFDHDHSSLLSLGTPSQASTPRPQVPLPKLPLLRGHQLQPSISLTPSGSHDGYGDYANSNHRTLDSSPIPNEHIRGLSLDTGIVTPMKAAPADTTPKEELLASEDYNSVFKSRPKIALSPQFTPTVPGSMGDRLSPELRLSGGESSDGDSSHHGGISAFSSPLATKGTGIPTSTRINTRRRL